MEDTHRFIFGRKHLENHTPDSIGGPHQTVTPKSPFLSPGSRALTKLLIWIVAILLCFVFWLAFVFGAFARTGRTGGKSLPGRPAVGFSVSADPGPSFLALRNSKHIPDFQLVVSDKLIFGLGENQAHAPGMENAHAKDYMGHNHRNALYNYYYVKYETLRLNNQNNIWCLLHNNTWITCLNSPDKVQFGLTRRTGSVIVLICMLSQVL